jgi:hypothetical protein
MPKRRSKIEQLINELCPEGVEFKELGEVARYSSQRIAATKREMCFCQHLGL